ncbi:hypothetical protein [Limosilactobacillus fermentum]|uniref:hypothetical protein n=1 Tax=Limosilactobacillus fermentum TaxID=1613 RepID=UPI001EDD12A3|nr:hypothetical protein [Limosilactobacillus fermentum]
MIIGFLLTMCMYAMSASILSVYVPELFPTRYRFQGKGYAAGSGRSSPKCWCKLNSANLSFHKLKHTGFF